MKKKTDKSIIYLLSRTAHIWFNCGAHIVLGEHDFEKTYQNIIKNLVSRNKQKLEV